MMILNFFLLSPNPNLGKDLKEIEIEYRLEFLTWIWYDVDLPYLFDYKPSDFYTN